MKVEKPEIDFLSSRYFSKGFFLQHKTLKYGARFNQNSGKKNINYFFQYFFSNYLTRNELQK